MQFTTFDIEFADVVLPSICDVSIIDWDEHGIVNTYKTMINPDCDIEEFLQERHKITEEKTKTSPTISKIWVDVYDRLENKIVFSHYANRNFKALKNLADINYLNMPPFIFCCSASISRKLWPYFKSDKLPDITERLGINDHHYNAYEDAKSVGYIVQKAMADTDSTSITELFRNVGFSGGFFRDGEKHIYRAIKRNGIFLAKVVDNDGVKELDLEKAEGLQQNEQFINSSIVSGGIF